MKNVFLILFAIFCFGCSALKAQVVHQLNEVLVESKSLSNAIEKQKNSITSTIVISSKDLNNFGHHTVGDVLKRVPRILVQGPPSFNRNIMMGGLDKQFQCILINGNRPAGGEDYRDLKLDRIPVAMVEEIVVMYNASSEWGGDASMGAVNIILKDAPEQKIMQANLGLDQTSTANGINPDLSLTYGNTFGDFSFVGSYSFNRFNRQNITRLSENEMNGTEEEDLNVKIHAVNSTLQYRLNDRSKLRLESFFSNYNEALTFLADIKRRSDGTLNFTADTADDAKLRRLHTQVLQLETKGENFQWRNSLNFGQNIDRKDRWRMTAKSSGLTESLEDEDQENTELIFRSDLIYNYERHRLKVGARASGLWRNYSRLAYSKIAGRKFWDEILDGSYALNEYRVGAYLADEFNLNNLILAPSLRFDWDQRSYQTTNLEGAFTYYSLNPSLHARYSFVNDLILKADFGRQIARPPFNAQVPVDKIKHKKSTIERGNSELLPSRSYNFGTGIEKYFSNSDYIALRGFYSFLRDVIEMKNVGIDEQFGYQVIQSVNVDSGKVFGIDMETRFGIIKSGDHELNFSGNASFLGSQVRDASSGKMRRLNEQPEWMSNASVDYVNTKLKVQVSIGVNHIGNRYIAGGTDEGTLIAPLQYHPFTQWDARLKYFFKPWGSVFINSVNLFNAQILTQQADVVETETIGRNVRLGINITL